MWVGIAGAEHRNGGEVPKAWLTEGLSSKPLEPRTIGRVTVRLPENFLRRAADFARAKKAASAISSVDLLESALTPAGPVYRTVFSKKLL